MQNAEIELKFPIVDLDRLQSLLPALDFQLDTPRTFEQNTLYDTPARTLRAARQILRIRRYGDVWTVTHKRPGAPGGVNTAAPQPAQSAQPPQAPRYKVRIETETEVEDGPALGALFQQLGYVPVFRYQKFRTAWSQAASAIGPAIVSSHLSGAVLFPDDAVLSSDDVVLTAAMPMPGARCHLVLDETPIGDFAELEGPPAWIDSTLDRLGIDPATCLTDSYGRLFLAWKERTGSSAQNLTFDEIPAAAELLQPSLR